MIDPVIATGLSGLQKSLRGADQAAQQIARGGLPDNSVTPSGGQTPSSSATATASPTQGEGSGLLKPIIDLKLYSISAQANAKVVKTGDQLLGTLLNTNA